MRRVFGELLGPYAIRFDQLLNRYTTVVLKMARYFHTNLLPQEAVIAYYYHMKDLAIFVLLSVSNNDSQLTRYQTWKN